MAGYLDAYGAGDERRNRIIKRIIIVFAAVVVAAVSLYLVFDNYREKQVVKRFLAQVNSGRYQEAYQDWACTEGHAHPCPEYSYKKFMEDWGAKSNEKGWSISDVDGCPTGVVVTVSAPGLEAQPLWVQRSDKSLSFSPWPECQGKRWRFRQFFRRVLGG
jgi:hypothetical protein